MSEVSGHDFTPFMQAWIRQRSHPTITLTTSQEDGEYVLNVVQSNYEKLHYEFHVTPFDRYFLTSYKYDLSLNSSLYVKHERRSG